MNISHDTIRHILDNYDCVPVNGGRSVTREADDCLYATWPNLPDVYAPLEDFEFELREATIMATATLGTREIGFRFSVHDRLDAKQLQQLIQNV